MRVKHALTELQQHGTAKARARMPRSSSPLAGRSSPARDKKKPERGGVGAASPPLELPLLREV